MRKRAASQFFSPQHFTTRNIPLINFPFQSRSSHGVLLSCKYGILPEHLSQLITTATEDGENRIEVLGSSI